MAVMEKMISENTQFGPNAKSELFLSSSRGEMSFWIIEKIFLWIPCFKSSGNEGGFVFTAHVLLFRNTVKVLVLRACANSEQLEVSAKFDSVSKECCDESSRQTKRSL